MAEVFLAEQVGAEGFRKRVVIKRLLPKFARQPKVVQMFLNEARLASLIDHPNVVQILDLGQDEQDFFIAMEFLDCRTFADLEDRARQRGDQIPIEIAVRILADACAGLAWAHDAVDAQGKPIGLIHRDFTPTNIAVTFDGRVKILDFGIAKSSVAPSETLPGDLKGKYSYMSPEMVAGQPFESAHQSLRGGGDALRGDHRSAPLPGGKSASRPGLDHHRSSRRSAGPGADVAGGHRGPYSAVVAQGPRRAAADGAGSEADDGSLHRHPEGSGRSLRARQVHARALSRARRGVQGSPHAPPAAVAAQATTLTERSKTKVKRNLAIGSLAVTLVVSVAVAVAAWRHTSEVTPTPVPAPGPSAEVPTNIGDEGHKLVVPMPQLQPHVPDKPKTVDTRPPTTSPGTTGGVSAAHSTNALLNKVYALRATYADGGVSPRPSASGGGAVPRTVEIGGVQVPLTDDENTLGHRHVEGAVDDVPPSIPRTEKTQTQDYADYLEERKGALSSCASWSPDGREVKGYLLVQWLVAPDGAASNFKVVEDNLNSPLVERCMARDMAGWRFDPPPHEPTTVKHTFYLTIAGRTEMPSQGTEP